MLYAFDGRRPRIGEGTYVSEHALVIGDVVIGENCYIGHGAILRGDYGTITIGAGTTLMEIWSFPLLAQKFKGIAESASLRLVSRLTAMSSIRCEAITSRGSSVQPARARSRQPSSFPDPSTIHQ